jgi:thiamine transporter 2/3
VVAAIWSIFFIPTVQRSIYFHRKENNVGGSVEESTRQSYASAFMLIWEHFKTSYRNETVVLWSVFYAISFCLYMQITAYVQVLWLAIDERVFWNATVDGTLTLLGALATLIAGKIQIAILHKQRNAMIVLIIMSLLQGVFMFFAATSQSLLSCYILFVLYGVAYGFCITICATKIAENIGEDSHGLVFGFNTFIALCIQTCLTLAIVSNGFKLSEVGQFVVYSLMYGALGFGYLVKILFDLSR